MFEVLDLYCGIGAFGEGEYLFGDVRRFWSFLESPRFFLYIPILSAPRGFCFSPGFGGALLFLSGCLRGGFFIMYRALDSWDEGYLK